MRARANIAPSIARKRGWQRARNLPGYLRGMLAANLSKIVIHVCPQIGWKPAPNQPKALERGTGKTNLKDVL